MSRSALAARLQRLERLRKRKRGFVPVIIRIHPADNPGLIVGAFSHNVECSRYDDEPLPEFFHRATKETGQRILCVQYLDRREKVK